MLEDKGNEMGDELEDAYAVAYKLVDADAAAEA